MLPAGSPDPRARRAASRASSSSTPSDATSSGLAGNPLAARRIAGFNTMSSERRPKRSMQRDPPVDASGDRDGAHVVAERHLAQSLGAHRRGVGTRSGPPAGVRARALRHPATKPARRGHRPSRTGAARSPRSRHWRRPPRRLRCRHGRTPTSPPGSLAGRPSPRSRAARVDVNGTALRSLRATVMVRGRRPLRRCGDRSATRPRCRARRRRRVAPPAGRS